jgi:hypothetical protein
VPRSKGVGGHPWSAPLIPGLLRGVMNATANIDWDKIGRIGLYTVPMAAKLLVG